ncbi:hypothetical protein ACH42_02720 [Endozoicomonas sp. (ex Bugula neritina AB1)]|nr:hypothetical protein ACH42_02720 [Endozoicomonas sp. (ex Bugula neritina AB1)]
MKALVIALLLTVCSFSYGQTKVLKPLQHQQQWQLLSYDDMPSNQVQFSNNRLIIDVNNSASPLIYPLSQPLKIQTLSMSLSVDGYLNLHGKQQGEENADDFIFRIGVVYEGHKQLSGFQKLFAPEWVQSLFQLAPKNTGINYIHFFNVYSDDRLSSTQRTHPASELIVESFAVKRSENTMQLEFQPDTNQTILALWISSDGDNTSSHYQVTLSNLLVQTK